MGTLCISSDIVLKAGLNAPVITDAQYTILIEQAEGWINSETREDWVTVYASLGANFKEVLTDIASSKAAMIAIAYDMSGYTSRAEAQTMLDVNWDIVKRGIAFLKEEKNKTKMGT